MFGLSRGPNVYWLSKRWTATTMELKVSAATTALLTLGFLHLSAAISPGPSVIFVAHTAANTSRKAGIMAALAMGVGAGVWAAVSLFGLDVVVSNLPLGLRLLQLTATLFLLWTGIKMILNARQNQTDQKDIAATGPFKEALTLQLSNPKVIAFFSSIFLIAMPTEASYSFRALVLLTICFNEVAWYTFVAILLSTPKNQIIFRKYKSILSTTCGLILIVAATKMLSEFFR